MDSSVIRDPYGMGGIDSRPVLTPNDPIETPNMRDTHDDHADAVRIAAWTSEMQREHDDAEQVRKTARQAHDAGNDDFEKGLKLYKLQMWLSRFALAVPIVLYAAYYIWLMLTDEP